MTERTLSDLLTGVTLMLQSKDGIHEVTIMMHDRGEAEAVLDALGALASVDTLPKGQDAQQGLAGTEGSAVGATSAETPEPGPPVQDDDAEKAK